MDKTRKSPQNHLNFQLTIKRAMYYLMYYFSKNPSGFDIDGFSDLISESGSFNQVISRKNIFRTVGDVPVHAAVRL